MQTNGVQITWLGHAAFKIVTPGGKVVLIDPWVTSNPLCPAELKKFEKVDLMLVSHGHFDHIADAVDIAKATKPRVAAIVELAGWLESKGVENTIGFNKGGTINVDNIKLSMTDTIHTAGVEDR